MKLIIVLAAIVTCASAVSFYDLIKEEWSSFKVSYSPLKHMIEHFGQFPLLFVSNTYPNIFTNTNIQYILRSKYFQIQSSDGPHNVTMHRKLQNNKPPFYC